MPILLDSFSKSLLKKPSDIKLDDFSKTLLDSTPEPKVAPTNPQDSLDLGQKILTNPIVGSVLDQIAKVVPPAPAPVVEPPMVGAMPPNRTRDPIVSVLEGLMKNNPIESISRTQAAMKGIEAEPGVKINPANYQDIIDRQRMREGAPQNVGVGEAIETPMAGLMVPMMGLSPMELAGMTAALTAKKKFISEPIRKQIPEGTGKSVFDLADLATDIPIAMGGARPAEALAAHRTAKQAQVHAEIAKDLPKIRTMLKENNPNLPDEVLNQITPEHVTEAAKTDPMVADYVNKVQAKVSPFSKIGLSTEDVSLPENIKSPEGQKPAPKYTFQDLRNQDKYKMMNDKELNTYIDKLNNPSLPKKKSAFDLMQEQIMEEDMLPSQPPDLAMPLKAAIMGSSVQPPTGQIPQPSPLHEEARKYKTAEEFVESQRKYHGTPLDKFGRYPDFETFKLGGVNRREKIPSNAFYFAPDEFVARQYGDEVKSRFLRMDNPLDLSTTEKQKDIFKKSLPEIEIIAKEEGVNLDKEEVLKILNMPENEIGEKPSFQWLADINIKLPTIVRNGVVNFAKNKGFDSIKLLDADRDGNYIADVVFENSQILKDNPYKQQLTAIWNEANKQVVVPPLRPESIEKISASPIPPPGERWTADRGTQPGEPFAFLDGNADTAKAALIERADEQGNVLYEAVDDSGQSMGIFSTVQEAKNMAERRIAPPAKPPVEPPVAASPAPEEPVPNLGKIIKEVQSETIQQKAAREIQEFASMPKGKKSFGFSPDVNQHLKSMKNVAAIQEQLSPQLSAKDVRKIINSNVGVKKKSAPVQMTEKAALKRELGQEQIASKQGEKAGRTRAIAELKNLFGNQTEALKRQAELQRLKDDILAREKSGAKFLAYKSKSEAKADLAKREAELQRLQDDIVARDKVRVKKEIISYVKEQLPVDVRGKYLTEIGNAHSASHLSAAFRRVDQEVKNLERKTIIEKLKTESSKALESGKVAVEYKKMIEEIMDGIELKKRRPETLDRLRRTRGHIEKQRAAGKDVELPDRILNQLEILNRRSADQLSVGELKSILANIEDLVKFGQTKLKSREAIYQMEKERITQDLIEGTMALDKNPLIVAEVGEKLTLKQKFENVLHKFNRDLQHLDLVITPMDTFFDLMDGGYAKFDGPNYRHYKAGMDTDYQTFLRDANKDAQTAISLANELKLNDQNFERIGVHAQVMQEGGRQKLLDRGMTDKQIDAITLTENEMKFYKMGRKLLESVRPGIEDTMKNVWNKPLGHVKDYWPMMTDFDALTDTQTFERFGEGVPEIIRPTKKTPQGFTKERTGGTQPVKVNAMDVLLKHMDDAHYLINMSRRIKMLSEIVNSDKVKAATGDLGTVMIKEWLDLMARKGGLAGQQRIAILDEWRRNFGLAQLGLNVSSALIQPTAVLDGASVIGNYAFDGVYQVITNRNVREFIFKNMPELKARVGDDPAFLDFGDNKFMTKAGQIGYAPLKFLDGITANGIAYGAYLKKLKELGIKEIDLNSPNKEAIAYAQSVVRQTQSSGLFKDAPLVISRGKLTGNKSFDKALLQFQSFMLSRWSIIRNRMWRANIQGGRDSDPTKRNFKGAFQIMAMLMIAYAMEAEIRRGVRWGTDKITGKLTKEKTTFTDDMVQSMVSTVPFVSQGVSMAVYKSDPIPSISGARNVIEGGYGLGKAVVDYSHGKKVTDKSKMVVDVLAGIGSLKGIPGTAQARKLIKSDIDSNSKQNIVNLYEKAMRISDQKERDKLWEKADQLSVEHRILKEDAQHAAETRVRKEITDIYEEAITKGDDLKLLEKADTIGKVAKFDEDELDKMYETAQKRIDKAGTKAEDIEEQSRTYKPRPGIFEEAQKLMSTFKR